MRKEASESNACRLFDDLVMVVDYRTDCGLDLIF
jgi:hypothetical protein